MPPGRLWLPQAGARRVRELAESAWPQEACGLLEGPPLSGAVHVARVLACANVAAQPARRFEIDPEAFLRAEHAARARGRRIVGVWHSHPHGDAALSATDRECAWPRWSYLIAGVTNGVLTELRCWWVDDTGCIEQAIRPTHRPAHPP